METLTIEKQAHGYQGFVIVPFKQAKTTLETSSYVTLQAPDEKPFWAKLVKRDSMHQQYIFQLMGIDQVPFHPDVID